MRLRWSVPLPGPLSLGGSTPLFGGRRRGGGIGGGAGLFVGAVKLCGYVLVAEAWILWWSLKCWYVLGVLTHRKITGQPTPIWRSDGGWW
ncbi:hypothetical protein ACIA6C_15990 [Streptomyces sp. NPDC051578]|uniref:hypothetical protein n=1 Tax=Streptomyces sp. NPDC051578 TaxID=3365662 RepID=UPI00379DA55D